LKICLKEDAYNDIRVLYQNSLNIFNKYVGGKLIDSFLIGVLLAICLIIGKFPYIILLSVVFGITNMIPYFGPFFAEIFGFAILMPVSFNAAITYLIMALAIQMFDCYILTPKILHSSMGVNPLIILLAVLIGGKICGFMGMLIGVPVLAVILNIFDYYITKIEKKKI
jgi:predicted PurR-regulated permease PerM